LKDVLIDTKNELMMKGHQMAERQDRSPREQSVAQEAPVRSAKGFVSTPSSDEVKPTEREIFLLQTLGQWQENSARSRIVLGQPIA
jgi:hypothetical protein